MYDVAVVTMRFNVPSTSLVGLHNSHKAALRHDCEMESNEYAREILVSVCRTSVEC